MVDSGNSTNQTERKPNQTERIMLKFAIKTDNTRTFSQRFCWGIKIKEFWFLKPKFHNYY